MCHLNFFTSLRLESTHGDAGIETGPPTARMLFAAEVVVVFSQRFQPHFIGLANSCPVERSAHRKSEEGEYLCRVAQAQAMMKVGTIVIFEFDFYLFAVFIALYIEGLRRQEHILKLKMASIFTKLSP